MSPDRPKFLPTFIDLVRKESEVRGIWALVPVSLLVSVALGAAVAFALPLSLWLDEGWSILTAVYVGLLTFGGLVLALGWSAFGRMYEVLFRGQFGGYLQDKGLLANYLVHISGMHAFQVLAVVCSGVGLVTILMQCPIWVDKVVFAATVASTVYALKQALDAVSAMNDLVWQSAYFERETSRSKGAVVNMRQQG
jgi:hypothetical protein